MKNRYLLLSLALAICNTIISNPDERIAQPVSNNNTRAENSLLQLKASIYDQKYLEMKLANKKQELANIPYSIGSLAVARNVGILTKVISLGYILNQLYQTSKQPNKKATLALIAQLGSLSYALYTQGNLETALALPLLKLQKEITELETLLAQTNSPTNPVPKRTAANADKENWGRSYVKALFEDANVSTETALSPQNSQNASGMQQ